MGQLRPTRSRVQCVDRAAELGLALGSSFNHCRMEGRAQASEFGFGIGLEGAFRLVVTEQQRYSDTSSCLSSTVFKPVHVADTALPCSHFTCPNMITCSPGFTDLVVPSLDHIHCAIHCACQKILEH